MSLGLIKCLSFSVTVQGTLVPGIFVYWGFVGQIAMLMPGGVAGRTLGILGPVLAHKPEGARPFYCFVNTTMCMYTLQNKRFPSFPPSFLPSFLVIDHYNVCLYYLQICMGGEVPSHHYTNHLSNVDMSLFTTTVVRRGSSLVLDYPVQHPNSVLRYARQLHFSDYMLGI